MYIVMVIIILTLTSTYLCHTCFFCKRSLTSSDKMANGRIRYRVIGTQLPVCRCCANHRQSEVE